MKKICMFCGKEHKKNKPKKCEIKNKIMNELADEFGLFKAIQFVENGVVCLETEYQKRILKGGE